MNHHQKCLLLGTSLDSAKCQQLNFEKKIMKEEIPVYFYQ